MIVRRPHGIDVSQYNTGNTFEGLGFVMIRATSADGGLHEDSQVTEHVRLAKLHRVPFGLYHFASDDADPIHQADLIVAVAHREVALKLGNLGIVIDCEGTLSGNVAQAVIREVKRQLSADHVHRSQVGIYSGGWVKAHGGGTMGADWGWLAHWTGSPTVPPSRPIFWSRRFTRLWQYAVQNGTDRDIYRGSRRSFHRWVER